MDEATRAAFYAAEAELLALPVPEDFDFDALERLYLSEPQMAYVNLAIASGISVAEAKALLKRVYGL